MKKRSEEKTWNSPYLVQKFYSRRTDIIFHHTRTENTTFALLSREYREDFRGGIFGPGMVKNSIRSTGVKLDSPYRM